MALGLEGIRILETATVYAAPMAGRLLADWGADVVKVEHPIRGDILRGIQNTSVGTSGTRAGKVIETPIDYDAENHNRNKRSMTLDLSKKRGQEVMHKMLATADVLLSNFRDREMKKFNLEWETLTKINPRLVHANLTGYGKDGPDKDLPGYDFLTFWARSGLLHVLMKPGMDPLITPLAVGDRMTGAIMALGIMTALFTRERTGKGQQVDASLLNTGVYGITCDIGGSLVTGKDNQQVDRKDVLNVLATFYQSSDGRWLRLGITQTDLYWSKFCQAIERTDIENDPRFISYESRIKNRADLFRIVETAFNARPFAEWKARLDKAGLPWGPVMSLPEVTNDPQTRANKFFDSYDHPTYGHIEMVAPPVKLSETPVNIRMPAPVFGQHTEEVLLEHGYTWEDIEQLRNAKVIA